MSSSMEDTDQEQVEALDINPRLPFCAPLLLMATISGICTWVNAGDAIPKPAGKEQLQFISKPLGEFAPVSLPAEDAGPCNHFGWPISTKVEDTIVVMYRRLPGHNPTHAGKPDEHLSYGIILTSDDGGQTWSKPYDLRDSMAPEDRNRGGTVPLSHRYKFDKGNTSEEGYKVHMHSIGTTHDGAVVAINNHGVFRSADKGKTWKHFPKALRDDTFPHPILNIGPRIIDHPKYGLLAFGNWQKVPGKNPGKSTAFVAICSTDGGETWTKEEYDVEIPQYEPAALLYENKILFMTRDQTEVREHTQMEWTPGKPPRFIKTNLVNPSFIDTTDLSFNPVTKRFELVRSERYHMQLWLWSMAPDEWETGKWTRECCLLATKGKFYSTADGFHPAAAVIDEKRDMQHIFIYAGAPEGPAGVYRLSRTLHTEALRPKKKTRKIAQKAQPKDGSVPKSPAINPQEKTAAEK